MISIILDGEKIKVEEGKMILKAAQEAGIDIPSLCYNDFVTPYAACRVCLVEVIENGRSDLVPACSTPVRSASP